MANAQRRCRRVTTLSRRLSHFALRNDFATQDETCSLFRVALAAPQRRICRFQARRQRICLGTCGALAYNVFAVARGGPLFFKRDQDVYRIVRVSGSSSQRVDERSRAVIAAGFQNATDARDCAFRWVNRYCPEATYLPDTGRWRLQDEDGSVHLFCIEASAAGEERNAA
jgi:hypothetical protein